MRGTWQRNLGVFTGLCPGLYRGGVVGGSMARGKSAHPSARGLSIVRFDALGALELTTASSGSRHWRIGRGQRVKTHSDEEPSVGIGV